MWVSIVGCLVRGSAPAFSVLRLHVLRDRLADRLPLPTLLGPGEGVDPALVVGRFADELPPALEAIRLEAAVGQGGRDRAARLAVVAAVPEPAAGDELVDVGEGLLEAVRFPEGELAHPRRVEHETPVGQQVELAPRRRVPAARVVVADLPDERPLLAS